MTAANGLQCICPRRVQMMDFPTTEIGKSSQCILQDSMKNWWVATRGGGLFRLPDDRSLGETSLSLNLQRPLSCLYETSSQQLIAGTRDGACQVFRDKGFEPLSADVTCSKVWVVAQTTDGRLWLGGSNGLTRFRDKGDLQNVVTSSQLGYSAITALSVGRGDELYFGTLSGRVFKYASDRLIELTTSPLSHISGVLPQSGNRLVVCTQGAGLGIFQDNQWRTFDSTHGLPDSRLTAMREDAHGYLWLGSLGGIFRVRLADLWEDRPQISVLWLNRSDGMATRECIGNTSPGIFKSGDGQLHFPTTGGVVTIDPKVFLATPEAPHVIIESCRINGRTEPDNGIAEPNVVGPGRQSIQWKFTCPEFVSPEKLRFQTRLLPLQKEWQSTRFERQASFESLGPGTYEFQVIAISGDGITSAVTSARQLIIQPEWWQRPWVQLVGILAGLALVAGSAAMMMRLRLKRRIQDLNLKHAQENERARIARDLHDDLGTSLTEISLLAEMHRPESPTHPLHRIAAKSHALVKSLDEIVWAINPKHDSSVSMMEYMIAFANEFMEQAGISLRLDLPRDFADHKLSTECRHGLFLCVREALNNIVKHSGATEAKLAFSTLQQQLRIIVSDNGCGFDTASTPKGDGLENFTQRLSSLGGQVSIDSAPSKGTTIQFILPLT